MLVSSGRGYVRGTEKRDVARGRVQIYLAVSDFPEGLKDLLCGVLILGHRDHESDKLLECHVAFGRADADELLMHLLLVVHQTQTCQGSREFELLQRVGEIPVEVPEH